MDPVTLGVTLVLGAEIAVACYAAVQLVRFHEPLKGQARFLDRLIKRDVRVALAGLAIGAVVVYALLRWALPAWNLPELPRPWGSLLIGGALMVALWGPIDDWLTVRRERQSR